jgi:AraC-like DNA-binding protein
VISLRFRGDGMEPEKVYAVQKMQDYIDLHIMDPITLLDLSKVCGYSPFYCIKIFSELMGKTPFEYIRLLRLSKAALKLRDENVKVIDTALDFMFDSHEGFTRAFSKEFGITPYRYSKNPTPIKLFIPIPILSHYRYYQRGEKPVGKNSVGNTVFVQIIERPERKFILKRGKTAEDYFSYCEETGCDIWGVLCSVKEALYEPIGAWLPEKLVIHETSKYVQGVEVPIDYIGEVPHGFDIIKLEPCSMMIFQGPPFDDTDDSFYDAINEIQKSMEKYNPNIYGYEWADSDAPRFQLEPQGWRGYIEARPVKRII